MDETYRCQSKGIEEFKELQEFKNKKPGAGSGES
jgi:hypothetical protein